MFNNKTIFSWLFWFGVWEVASRIIDSKIFLPAPHLVLVRLFELFTEQVFYKSIAFTFTRIAQGFFLGAIIAVVLSVIAYRSELSEILLKPLMLTIKSVPVASFIILVLIWFSSKNLSVLISFLMVLPVVYTNVLQGLKSTDKNLIEMAKVYKISVYKRIRFIYLFEVFPYFKSAITVAIGLSFKAGIAAEVIGMPSNSIGEQIFNSKIYLDTITLFSWTIVVLLLSLVFEKIVILSLGKIIRKLEDV